MISTRTKIALQLGALATVILLVGTVLVLVIIKGTPVVRDQPETTQPRVTGTLPSAGGFTLPDTSTETTDPQTGLPISPVASGGQVLTAQLTSSAISAPTLTNGNQISYYDARDGKFYTIDNSGNIVSLSSVSFPSADSVTFSNSSKTVAIEFPDGSNILYDFETDTQTTLPSHWEEFTFSSDSSTVASKSIGIDSNNRALILTSKDGTRTTTVTALGENADDVTINFSPDDSIVAFSETGVTQTAFGREQIYLIDETGDVAGSLIVEGSNFSAIWSPNNSHMLYSVSDAARERPTLWYAKASGTNSAGERMKIQLETWVEKCTFKDAKTVICAVPRAMVDSGGFDHRLVTSADDIYSINVTSGRTTLLGSPVSEMQIFNLNLSSDGSILYFTDGFGRLNTMRLK